MTPPWHFELLGGLRARRTDQLVTRFQTRKTASLLAYLAYHSQRPSPRELLTEILWPECEPAAGRHRLAQALYSLRCQLEPPGTDKGSVLQADKTTIQLSPLCPTDVAQFDAALRAAGQPAGSAEQLERLTAAVTLYQGDLLPGHFEDWVFPERQRLQEAFLHALHQLTRLAEEAGETRQALEWARQAVAADALREESQHAFIRLLLAAGRGEAAWRQYRQLEELLAREMGTEPAAETRALLDEYLAGRRPLLSSSPECATAGTLPLGGHAGEDAPEAGAHSLRPLGGRLPRPLTRFFGREEEMQEIIRWLGDGQCRLLTLAGPGGSGKTRLSLEVAQRLVDRFRGAVWFVPFVDLGSGELIVGAILDALGIPRSSSADPLGQVVSALSEHPSLLIVDNLEHVIEAAAAVIQILLERAPTLICVATSRQLLNIPGEHAFPVRPLPLPSAGREGNRRRPGLREPHAESAEPSDLARLCDCPSVQLFVDRAQAVRPDFQVTRANTPAVAALCEQLDGLPLALELAAARIAVLTPQQMVSRFEKQLDLLAGRRRQVDPRHRSLRAALDWSYQLLSPELQRFLSRLSIFRGGWTLEAAEVILREPQTLEQLEQLREHSLVSTAEHGTVMRYGWLESVREFAGEQLSGNERAELARRHRDYFLELAERARPELDGPSARPWLGQLDAELPNFRVALDTCAERGEVELELRLGIALKPFWELRSHLQEGRERLAAALSRETAVNPVRAMALAAAARLALVQGDHSAARQLYEANLAAWRELGDRCQEAIALQRVGQAVHFQGDHAAAHAYFLESLNLLRELDREPDPGLLFDLGNTSRILGDYALSRRYCEECIRISRGAGSHYWAWPTLCLGNVATAERKFAEARAAFDESLRLFDSLGFEFGVVHALRCHVVLAGAEGEEERAARLLGALERLREDLGMAPWGDHYTTDEWTDSTNPPRLRKIWSDAWTEGRDLSSKGAVAYALRELAPE